MNLYENHRWNKMDKSDEIDEIMNINVYDLFQLVICWKQKHKTANIFQII